MHGPLPPESSGAVRGMSLLAVELSPVGRQHQDLHDNAENTLDLCTEL